VVIDQSRVPALATRVGPKRAFSSATPRSAPGRDAGPEDLKGQSDIVADLTWDGA